MSMLRRVVVLRVTTVGGAALMLSLAVVPGAHATPATPTGPSAPAAGAGGQLAVRGLDISAYQHGSKAPIDWLLLARHGIRFVAVKATEGTYYRNPYYGADTRAAATAGLAVLPYVFANPATVGGAPTARYAIRVTGRLRGPGRLPLVIDLENDPYKAGADCYGVHRQAAMIGWIAGFIGQARALTGKWPVIYTTASWWGECTGATSRFRRDPLWLAAFGGTRPSVPSTWQRWTFWQYNNAGRLPGISPADLDYFQPTGELPALMVPVTQDARVRSAAASRSPAQTRHLVRHRGRP